MDVVRLITLCIRELFASHHEFDIPLTEELLMLADLTNTHTSCPPPTSSLPDCLRFHPRRPAT